jgi:glutathione S-transferase
MRLHEPSGLPMAAPLKLISHKLCPYVQRAVIALNEKGVPFERIDIDLAAKPDWFLKISPLGKTPVLLVGEHAIFESAVILEYLEETQPNPIHPGNALHRADHRAFIEYGSAILNDIAGLYSAPDEAAFKAKAAQLEHRFARLETRVIGPWFDGEKFSLVDAAFGPVFRYFDVFDGIGDFGILASKPKLQHWRENLATRPSVKSAVGADYPVLLRDFIERRRSHLAQLQAKLAA